MGRRTRQRPHNPVGFQGCDALYHVYLSMYVRCYKPQHPTYKHYGARGIKMCDEWVDDNVSFFQWAMKNGYKPGLTLDRIDVNKDYSPENCRWVDWVVQNNNKRNNRILTARGESHTLAEWSNITGVGKRTIANRIDYYDWDVEDALFCPAHSINPKRKKVPQ